MNRRDFLKLIGADQAAVDYLPVAVLLRSGYGCAGYFNTSINHGLDEMVVLLNARLIGFKTGESKDPNNKASIGDFNQFLEQIVLQHYQDDDKAEEQITDAYGKSIPLAAIQTSEVAVLYPVAQIGKMLRHIKKEQEKAMGRAGISKPVASAQADTHAVAAPAAIHPTPPVGEEKHGPVHIPDEIELAVQKYDDMQGTSLSTWPGAKGSEEPLSTKAMDRPRQRVASQTGPTKTPAAAAKGAPGTPPAGTPGSTPAPKPEHGEEHEELPSFLDFNNKSVVLSMLRTKLW